MLTVFRIATVFTIACVVVFLVLYHTCNAPFIPEGTWCYAFVNELMKLQSLKQ